MELIGWKTPEEAAADVWCSIHSSLLKGELLLGYKNLKADSEVQQLILVRNSDNTFGIGLMTNGYTALLPAMSKEYLSDIFLDDVKSQKINKQVLETLKNIIEKL